MKGTWLKQPLFVMEAALVYLLYGLMALLPLDLASGFGGWLARSIGPLLPVTRKVGLVNLRKALPGRSPEEYRRLMSEVWDNLGRTFGEYPHLTRIVRERLSVEGAEHLDIMRGPHRPGICISCHSGNWEICPALASFLGLPLATVYRAPNNPWVDRLLCYARRPFDAALLPKGASGAKRAIATLQAGGRLGLLVDQKMNDGIAAPFFGRSAMTAPAVVQLSMRYRCPIVPAFVERLKGARFRVVIQPPLVFPTQDNRSADLLAGVTLINRTVEAWVRAHPGQWLWLHRRWPKESSP